MDDLQKLVNVRVVRLKSRLVWGDKIVGNVTFETWLEDDFEGFTNLWTRRFKHSNVEFIMSMCFP